MATKKKRGGRKAGVPNKISATAKENIIAVFTRLGGTHTMANWARRNKTDFYRLYARLIPTELTTPPGKPLQFEGMLPAEPELIGKYYERLAQIAADRAARRPHATMGRAGVPPDREGEESREG